MNGVPVSPGEKTENAPTWRPRCHENQALFRPIFRTFSPPKHHQHPLITSLFSFKFTKSYHHRQPGKAYIPTPNSDPTPNTTNIQELQINKLSRD